MMAWVPLNFWFEPDPNFLNNNPLLFHLMPKIEIEIDLSNVTDQLTNISFLPGDLWTKIGEYLTITELHDLWIIKKQWLRLFNTRIVNEFSSFTSSHKKANIVIKFLANNFTSMSVGDKLWNHADYNKYLSKTLAICLQPGPYTQKQLTVISTFLNNCPNNLPVTVSAEKTAKLAKFSSKISLNIDCYSLFLQLIRDKIRLTISM